MPDSKLKIQEVASIKTPYDGISPEVFENNEARDMEQHIRAPKFRGQCTSGIEAMSGKSQRDNLSPERWLLTPDFCLSKMKVTPGILMKTKDGGKAGIRCQVSGVREKALESLIQSRQSQAPTMFPLVFCLLTPVSCNSKNEGDSGDVDENKGQRKSRVGVSGAGSQRKSIATRERWSVRGDLEPGIPAPVS